MLVYQRVHPHFIEQTQPNEITHPKLYPVTSGRDTRSARSVAGRFARQGEQWPSCTAFSCPKKPPAYLPKNIMGKKTT